VSWTHERISDVVDHALVVTKRRYLRRPRQHRRRLPRHADQDVSLPLDGIGFHGGRPISEEKPVEGSIELTQDLPTSRTHWGIQIEHIAERKTEYRYDEIKREAEGMGWTLFVEQEVGKHWRVRAEATDLLSVPAPPISTT